MDGYWFIVFPSLRSVFEGDFRCCTFSFSINNQTSPLIMHWHVLLCRTRTRPIIFPGDFQLGLKFKPFGVKMENGK